MKSKYFWTELEINYLKTAYPTSKIVELQKALPSRTKSAIKTKAENLNLAKNIRRINYDKIKELNQKGYSDGKIAAILNSSVPYIYHLRKNVLKLPSNFKHAQHSRDLGKNLYFERKKGKLEDWEIADKYNIDLHKMGELIGLYLMDECRKKSVCPFKALLPEYEPTESAP